MGDAMMMLHRGRCRKGDAENNCSGKRNFYLAEHFYYFEFSPIPSFTTNASAPSPGVFEDNPRDKRATHQSLIGGQIITFGRNLVSNANTRSGGNADSRHTRPASRSHSHRREHHTSRHPNCRH
jgi:hypothetical protein